MKTLVAFLAAFVLFGVLFSPPAPVSAGVAKDKAGVRKPAVAGQFYPAERDKLAKAVDGFLADAVAPSDERPIALVCPHAGYIFSGQIAADAYKQASRHAYDLVIILGVNHTTAGFQGVALSPAGGFETPLGVAEVDEALARTLAAADKRFTFDEKVHAREHSIEVQLPFIQRLFPGAMILPAVVASDPDLCIEFGKAVARAVAGRKVLIVASSDLSHYPEYRDAVNVDRRTMRLIGSFDLELFRKAVSDEVRMHASERNLDTVACGGAPILAAMAAAKKLGATGTRMISYANSGDTSVGDRSRVVGYGAVAFVAGKSSDNLPPSAKSENVSPTQGLTKDEKTALLSFARKTIVRFLTTDTTPLARGFDPALQIDQGAFVTLTEKGELRGCIGHMAEDMPLCQVVGFCALQSAFNDRRFSPVEVDEVDDIDIEISVLTPYRRVGGYDDIRIGKDGVLMEKDGRSAVFLPSVAVEQGWSRDEMLSHLSAKAGLPTDAWKKDAVFYTFQAVVFSESDLH